MNILILILLHKLPLVYFHPILDFTVYFNTLSQVILASCKFFMKTDCGPALLMIAPIEYVQVTLFAILTPCDNFLNVFMTGMTYVIGQLLVVR